MSPVKPGRSNADALKVAANETGSLTPEQMAKELESLTLRANEQGNSGSPPPEIKTSWRDKSVDVALAKWETASKKA